MVEKATVAVLWGIPILYAMIALWKLLGVLLGELLLARNSRHLISFEDAVDGNRSLRRRFGRFNFNGVLGLLWASTYISSFVSKNTHQKTILETVDSLISPATRHWFNLEWRLIVPLMLVAIAIVEVLDFRQRRSLPDPEDPVGAKMPPFRDSTGLVGWVLISFIPFAIGAAPGKAWYLAAVFAAFGALTTLPFVAYFKRRARFFRLPPDSAESSLIGRVAAETSVRIRAIDVEADDRCYAYVDPLGKVVMSHRFAEKFNAAEKRVLLSYELARSRFALRNYGTMLSVSAGIALFSVPLGALGAAVIFILFLLLVYVAIPYVELLHTSLGRAYVASLGSGESALLETYLGARPSPGWNPLRTGS